MVEWVEIGNAKLALGDCRDILPTLGRVGAVVTDPPYGQSYKHSGHGRGVSNMKGSRAFTRHSEPIFGDDHEFSPEQILQLEVPTVLWGAHQFAHTLPKGSWLVWDKVPTGKSRTFGDGEVAWVGGIPHRALRILRHLWDGVCVADRADLKNGRVHPMQKPVFVMEWSLSTIPADRTILDPYMGSGTTGVACAHLGRSFIGIEIDPRHFDTACRRIEAAQVQTDLFVPDASQPEGHTPDMSAEIAE